MFQYLGGTGTGSTHEAECVEGEIGFCAEAKEVREWDWRKYRRRLHGRRIGSGIIELFLVGDVARSLEGEPLLSYILEVLLFIRHGWCGGHGGGREVRMLRKSKSSSFE